MYNTRSCSVNPGKRWVWFTAQKKKFSIKDFFSKYDQIRRKQCHFESSKVLCIKIKLSLSGYFSFFFIYLLFCCFFTNFIIWFSPMFYVFGRKIPITCHFYQDNTISKLIYWLWLVYLPHPFPEYGPKHKWKFVQFSFLLKFGFCRQIRFLDKIRSTWNNLCYNATTFWQCHYGIKHGIIILFFILNCIWIHLLLDFVIGPYIY